MKKIRAASLKRKLQMAAFVVFVCFAAASLLPRLFTADANTDAPADNRLSPVSAAEANQLPEIQNFRHAEIGLGQRLTFGVEVIDEEGDNVRVELIKKPKSAKFNQNTLTVDWTPQKSDGKVGKFVVKVTELPRDKSRQPRVLTKQFNIKVVKNPVELRVLPPTSLEVDAFVSVIDPARLAAANKKWNIINLFQRIAEIEADKQIKPGGDILPTTGERLFRDALKELAVMHKNAEIDPDSPQFNKQWNAEHWKLTAVRPRVNKKVFELRLVYFNTEAAEQVYLMPRMRIVRGGDAKRPDELRQKNNYVFAKMFHEAFFEGENMKPFVANDKARYGEALADFITRVLTYNDPEDSMMRANLAAIPHNSRLGGGNKYDENGKYLFGDGWALGAMKVGPVERDGKKVLAMISPPIDGFVASIEPNAEKTAFKPFPAPATDADDPAYRKGWDILNEEDHGVAIPDSMPNGAVKKSNVDTTLNPFEVPGGFRFAETNWRDPRRRLFEEKGMTCMQCHVRNFDEGDYLVDVSNPQKAPQNLSVRPIPRVFFVIVPTLHGGRNEYIHREEQEQVGNMQGVFRDYLGVKVKINSPLANDWVHNTKKGRS